MKWLVHSLILAILLLCTGCEDYPRDTNHSWENAHYEKLKVGIVHNPPYTIIEDSLSFAGEEVNLIKKFAQHHDLELKFYPGNESAVIKMLKNYEIHLVAGGFERNTVWKMQVVATKSYDRKHVFLIPRGENRLLYQIDEFFYKLKNRKDVD